MKKKAFTLAEVLITLGIIGVVAALTLPALQQKMENRSLRTAFLKQYRNILTVMNEIQAENGVAYECGNNKAVYENKECVKFWDDFFAKYKVLKSCKYKTADCTVMYKTKAQVLAQGGSVTNGSCSFFDTAVVYAYMLPDGATIFKSNNQGYVYFAMDVNGDKGPNRWGYDLFYMTLDKSKGSLHITDSVCAMWESGGRRIQNMLLDTDKVDTGWYP